MAFPFDFHPSSHPRLPSFPSTRRVDFKSTGWCWDRQRHRTTTRATTTAPSSSKIHAQFRAFYRAFRARKAFQSITKRGKRACHVVPCSPKDKSSRSTSKMPHSIYTKIVCVRLPVATAIWRTIIHCYWMIALLIQYVGLVWNPPTHLSVCLSAIAYTLYSDGWTHTVTPEYINLPHTLSAYSSWSVHIFTYSI